MILAELDCLSLRPLSCCLLIKTGQNICVWLLSLSHLLSCLVIFCDHYFQWAGAMQIVDLAPPSNTSLQMWSSALVFCTPLVYERREGRQGSATQSPWKWYFGTGSEVKKTPEDLPTSQMFYSYLPIYYVFLLCTSFLFLKENQTQRSHFVQPATCLLNLFLIEELYRAFSTSSWSFCDSFSFVAHWQLPSSPLFSLHLSISLMLSASLLLIYAHHYNYVPCHSVYEGFQHKLETVAIWRGENLLVMYERYPTHDNEIHTSQDICWLGLMLIWT